MTMVTKDADGNELGRLSELPGVITGGTKEQWYESTQVDSLLHIKIGPMGKNLGGTVNLTVSYKVWNGFRLSQLPYFDRLFRVFSTLPNSSATEIECLHKGIAFFNASLRLQELEFVQGLATLFISLSHAREICKKFDVDPIWNLDAFTQDDYETIEELYGIFFQGGSTSMLRTGLTGRIEDVEAFDRTKWPDNVTVTGHYIYTLLGEKIDVGRLNRKMTNMVGVRKKSAITLKPTAKSELTVTQAAPETAQGN